ncbi:MAG: hypothetical protein IT443_10665 [Phycisphaeraceae bacterium]|nr:hypothetical protein [Phycisphaeraceae bacterium]
MPVKELLVLHHTHTDVGYTHPQPMFWELSRRYIDQAIDLADQTADWPVESRFRWTCEVAAPVGHWLRHASGRQVDRFRAAALRGQMSVGVLPYNLTPLCTADELARGLYPLAELRARLGVAGTVAINHDVNGLPWPIGDLLLDAGARCLVMGINIGFGGYPLHRPLAFKWKTPAGRSILVMSGEHYGAFDRETKAERGSLDLMAEGLAKYLRRLESKSWPWEWAYLTATHHGAQGDNNPPFPQMAELIRKWNEQGREPVIRTITPEMLLERLEALPAGALAEYSGDWTDYWNFGSGSTALEVSMARRARARWVSGQTLRITEAIRKDESYRPEGGHWPTAEERAQRSDEVFAQLLLFDEHTWGCANSIGSRVPSVVAEQWHYKAAIAAQARSLAGTLVRDELERISGNPLFAQGVQGVMFFNSSPFPRREIVRLPRTWVNGEYQHLAGTCLGIEYGRELLNDETSFAAGPVELPAFGYATVPVKELVAGEVKAPAGCCVGDGFLESPTLRLTFDQGTGRVTGLYDKTLGWQVVASGGNNQRTQQASPCCVAPTRSTSADEGLTSGGGDEWPLFGFVHETIDPAAIAKAQAAGKRPRDIFFDQEYGKIDVDQTGWRSDWPAVRNGPGKLLSCVASMSARGPKLELAWEAPGCVELRQTILLRADRPTVAMEALIQKQDQRLPESIYFALPLNLPGWRANFDTADVPTEFDREQLPGVSRDWITVGQYVAVHNGQHAVTLACPDAPLVQLGGFNFGKGQKSVPDRERCLVLAWALNNYWSTNFRVSQPGDCRVNYELTTHAGFDPVVSAQLGTAAAQPIEAHPLMQSSAKQSGRTIEVQGVGVNVLAAGPAQDGKEIMVRLANVTDKAARATMALPGRMITRAWLCDGLEKPAGVLEVKGGRVEVEIPGRAIRAVRMGSGS